MNLTVGPRWEEFLDEAVKSGRYASASEVVQEGLKLVEARERKLKALPEHLDAAVAEGGSYTSEEVMSAVDEALVEWERKRCADRNS